VRPPFRRLGSEGAALLEILVAVTIFAVCALGLANAVVNGRKTTDGSRHATEATTLALDKIEELRGLPGTAAALAAGSHAPSSDVGLTPTGGAGGIYTRTWTVTDAVPVFSTRRVDVTVAWRGHAGNASVRVGTYLIR
jgi:Tfp pilus assembly protein PilV